MSVNESEQMVGPPLGFDEFKDRDYADWKRVRSAIEHENHLINHRTTWLFSSQAFLLGAYTVAFNQWAKGGENSADAQTLYPGILLTIALAGLYICVVTWRALRLAAHQLRYLDNWWYIGRTAASIEGESERERERDPRAAQVNGRNLLHPPLQGSLRIFGESVFGMDRIPLGFATVWLCIAGFTIFRRVQQISAAVQAHALEAWATLATIGFLIVFVMLLRKVKAE